MLALQFISVRCPECGANLPIEEGRTQIFCSYCGAKVIVTNENEYIIRHIDEASIKQAETDRIIKLKQLEIVEKKRAANERAKSIKIIISLILAVVGMIMLATGDALGHSISLLGFFPLLAVVYIWIFSSKKDEDDDDFVEKIKVPFGISDYEKKNYIAIEAMFKSAGFTNIQCIPLDDLTIGLIKKPNSVESIMINGKEITTGGMRVSPNSKVIISYHSIPSK